jgi:hypothetical protein
VFYSTQIKYPTQEWHPGAGAMAQVTEYLLNKHKSLSSKNPNTRKKKKEEGIK